MNKKIRVIKDLKNHLSHHFGEEIVDVILFGSQARNDELTYSDYDILIILKSGNNWRIKEQIIDLSYDINLKYNIILDIHILAEKEINEIRGKQPVFLNAIKNGKRA